MFRSIALILTVVCILSAAIFTFSTVSADTNKFDSAVLSIPVRKDAFDKVSAVAEKNGKARIIVGLNIATIPDGDLDREGQSKQRADIKTVQNEFVNKYAALRASDVPLTMFEFIPFVAAEADLTTIDLMRRDPMIRSIEEDVADAPHLSQSTSVVNAQGAWNAGFTGTGWNVAVLDTGVQKTHQFLSGRIVSEACYSSNGTANGLPVTSVCPGAVIASTATGSGVNCDPGVSGCAHGTHVAGIAGGSNASFSGVAKTSGIIAIQVFSKFDSQTSCGSSTAPCTLAYVSDQIKGLERVYALRTTLNIAAVNMSLGGGNNTTNCDATEASRKAAIDNLRSANIATVASSGNNGYTNAMGSPACISSAISVGNTGDGSSGATLDVVNSSSNSASFLTMLAPGYWISSSVPTSSGSTSSYQNYSGTSMAAPHVAGAYALLRQSKPNATVSQITNALVSTGQPVTDLRNNITKPRINIGNALTALNAEQKTQFDFDGDGRSDLSTFRPSNGAWYLQRSLDGFLAFQFGLSSDIIAPADYDGDGKTDLAVFRPSTGTWYIHQSSNGVYTSAQFGANGDVPVGADFDGDGKADKTIFRNGVWFVNRSSDNGFTVTQFGQTGDRPVANDFDGDGRADIGIYRPSNGQWWINRSTAGMFILEFGTAGDRAVPADYTGDGKTDVGVYRPSTGQWLVLRSEDYSFFGFQFGISTDSPAPADYDGDGKADPAVFRSSGGEWYILGSTSGIQFAQFGSNGDRSVPSAYVY